MKQSFFAPLRPPFPSKASPDENLLRITGLVVIIAVRWHSIAFLRPSRTDTVSLDDLCK